MSKQSKFILLAMTIFLCISWNLLHRERLHDVYNNYTPGQIVQAYHDAYIDVDVVCFLSHSNNAQQNILELPDNSVLLFAWVDSVRTFQTKTYVYSTFKYGALDFDMEHIITCIRIRETLYYKDDIWRVGLGKIIDIGCLDRVKNIDYINIEV